MRDVFDRVRELAATLPQAEETTHYGTPAFKVRGKMFARLHELGDVLVVRLPIEERERMTAAAPEKYFITSHYTDYPAMLVRLPAVTRRELLEALTRSWRFVAPVSLLQGLEQAPGPKGR